MSRGRRIKPSTVEGRKRKAELGKIIASARTPKAEREAARRELETLAPLASGQDLQDWNERIETAKENGSHSPVKAEGGSILSPGTPDSNRLALEQALAQLAIEDRARAIRRAENATPLEKAQALLAELPEHALNKMARELAAYLWREDQSNPKPDIEQMIRWTVEGWLARPPFNRNDVRGNVQTVSDAVADVYRLLAERDTADAGWFVRRAEKFDSPALPPVKKTEPPLEPAPQTFSASLQKEEQPVNENLAARVSLVLAADSSLSRLAAHSSEYDSGIRAAISRRLLSHSNCDGTFLAGLYNAQRPRALSQFPERKF